MAHNPKLWTYVGIFVGAIIFGIYDIGRDIAYNIIAQATPDMPVLQAKLAAFGVSIAIGIFFFHKMSMSRKPQNIEASMSSPSNSASPPRPNRTQFVWTDWIAIGFVPFAIVITIALHLFYPYPVAQNEYPQNHFERISNPLYK